MEPPLQPQDQPTQAMRLFPLWPGFAVAALSVCFELGSRLVPISFAYLAAFPSVLCTLGCIVYYFALQYRMTKVLEDQPAWWGSYSAAGIIGRQLIPLYGLYVLFYWTKEVGRYTDWRLSRRTELGLWAFLMVFLSGFVSQYIDWLGFVVPFCLIGSCALLYPSIQRALTFPEPGERIPQEGTLGLNRAK